MSGRTALPRLALLGAVVLAGCAPGTRVTSTEALDYARDQNWAALPSTADAADQSPIAAMAAPQPRERRADVFFVHPTTYLSMFGWNATTDDERLNNLTAKGPIRLQASAFNGCCRVFAPRYRQAALRAFMSRSPRARDAMDLAYGDVRQAFLYYLEHLDEGRPLIIASHSQGTLHAIRLLEEFFADDPTLRGRLVVAYLIGWPLACDGLPGIPACERASDTGCFVSWSTYVWGTERAHGKGAENACCVNPLTWQRGDGYAPAELNLGGIPYKFDRIDPGVTDARCVGGKLWVHKPDPDGYIALGRNLHLMDYNLFYANIRENARQRVQAFLKRR
ncbi:MAG: DUF3089 domain-containing protein [Chromatiales bacterium]|jgi:hypothetical protein